MSPLRAGVVGLDTMGRNHVRVLRDLPGVDLVGATDRMRGRRMRPGQRIARAFTPALPTGHPAC